MDTGVNRGGEFADSSLGEGKRFVFRSPARRGFMEKENENGVDPARDRILPDRRRHPTPMISRYTFRGRRRVIRREEDRRRNIYVDRYGLPLILLLLSILALGTADAFLTLYHVRVNDAREMNPVMDFFLGKSPHIFFHVKFVLTALCLLVLCFHKNLPMVKYILTSVFILYMIIVINHIYMFFKIC
jgi:hypothetical protein